MRFYPAQHLHHRICTTESAKPAPVKEKLEAASGFEPENPYNPTLNQYLAPHISVLHNICTT